MKMFGLNCEPQLVVMLTHNDYTVENAEEIFESCKDSEAVFWGLKEQPLNITRMKDLFSRMKDSGKTTVLEVVAYDKSCGLRGAELAAECGCDLLMGTKFHASILDFCNRHGIGYLPFAGTIEGRPSVLSGNIGEIVSETLDIIEQGADGIDLLGYRHVTDPVSLNKAVCRSLPGKVCIAGSVDSYRRLDEIKEAKPALFTIGSAFFENRFGGTFCGQIDKVCRYMRESKDSPK